MQILTTERPHDCLIGYRELAQVLHRRADSLKASAKRLPLHCWRVGPVLVFCRQQAQALAARDKN